MVIKHNGVSRVEYKRGSSTVILFDLTGDTVTPETMVEGVTAHNAAGMPITGTLKTARLYTGSTAPAGTLGNDGDIYLQK